MKKIVFKVKHNDKECEIRFIVAKGKIEDYYIVSESEDLKFSIQSLIDRTVNYTLPKRTNGLELDFYVSFGEEKLEEFLFILPDILAWHGFVIEEVAKISDRTIKSLSHILPNEEVIETEDYYDDSYGNREGVKFGMTNNVLKAVSEIVEKVLKTIDNPVEIVLKSAIDSLPFNEKGILEKVPAGYIAYNTEDGRILVGGKFLGVSRETLEKGEPWVLLPAERKPNEESLAKLAIAKLNANREPTLPELIALIKTEAEKKKEGEVKLQDILQEKKIKKQLEELSKIIKEHGITTLKEAQKVVQATQTIQNPSASVQEYKAYYVFDPEKKLLADLPTYLANREMFSPADKLVIVKDEISEAKRVRGVKSQAIASLIFNHRLRLEPNSQEFYIYDEIINDVLTDSAKLSGRNLTLTELDYLKEIMKWVNKDPKNGIPITAIHLNTGEIVQLSDDILKVLDLPNYLKRGNFGPYKTISSDDLTKVMKLISGTIPVAMYSLPDKSKVVQDSNFPSQQDELKVFELGHEDKLFRKHLMNIFWEKDASGNPVKITDDLTNLYKAVGITPKQSERKPGNLGEMLPAHYLPQVIAKLNGHTWNNIRGFSFKPGISFHPHQVQALLKGTRLQEYKHFNPKSEKVGMFFAHSTGTGKTVTGLSLYGSLVQLGALRYENKETGVKHDYRPAMIVANDEILDNWQKDAQMLYGWDASGEIGSTDIVRISGSPEERRQTYLKLVKLWAEAQVNPRVKLPKLILVKMSIFQGMKGQEYHERYEGSWGDMDKFFLQLLSNESILPLGTKKVKTQGGLFGTLILDEASQFFSSSSKRRKHLEDIAFSITSEKNKGFAFIFNANAMANSPDDFLSMLRFLYYQPKLLQRIIGTFIEKTGRGVAVIKDEFLKVLQSGYLDVVSRDSLKSKTTLNLHPYEEVYLPGEIDPNEPEEFKEVKRSLNKLFLLFGGLIVKLHRDKNDRQKRYSGMQYGPTSAGSEHTPPIDVYRKYVPGFVTLLTQAEAGAVSWERLYEYGILSWDVKGPFMLTDEKGQQVKPASLKEVVEEGFVETFSSLPDLVLDKFARSPYLQPVIQKIKEYKRTKEESPENTSKIKRLKDEIVKLFEQKNPKTGESLAEIMALGAENAVKYGLSSLEIPFTANEILASFQSTGTGKKLGISEEKIRDMLQGGTHLPLRLPGYGWIKKVDLEKQMEGTRGEKNVGVGAFETESEITGSERKLSIETRNRLLRYSFLIPPMLSNEKYTYYPVVINEGQGNFKIKLARMDKNTGIRTIVSKSTTPNDPAVAFLGQNDELDENMILGSTNKGDIKLSDLAKGVAKKIDEASYEATTLSKPFQILMQKGLQQFVNSGVSRKAIIATPSRKVAEAADYFIKTLRKRKGSDILKQVFGTDEVPIQAIQNSYKGSIVGDTPLEERRKVIEDFQKSTSGIVVLSAAGGRGLNLPASTIAINASTFSAELISQMLGRAFRVGGSQRGVVDANIVLPSLAEAVLNLKQFQRDKLFDPTRIEASGSILTPDEDVEHQEIMTEREAPFAEKVVDALIQVVQTSAKNGKLVL